MKSKNLYIPSAVFLTLILAWEIIVRLSNTPLYILPAPSNILTAMIKDGNVLISHSIVTMTETLVGLFVALVLGVTVAILMDRFNTVYLAMYPLLIVSQTIPVIVLAPIFIIYLGFGFAPKILIVTIMCFFPITISFLDGMRDVDKNRINLARLFGASNFKVYTIVKIPAAAPGLFSGLKVAATYSVTGAVVGEWIGSGAGLGYYMIRAKNGFMLDKVFACVVAVIILSLAMNSLVKLAERMIIPGIKIKGE